MQRWLILFLLFLLPAAVSAEQVAIPELTAHVTDLTGTLTTKQVSTLEARLQALELQKGSQIAVLLVPTTQPETIEQYSIRVVDQWKIGRKKVDDGVLLLIAKADRKLRIEVGYGLEGVLPDVIAKRIIAEDITPHFKQGDFYGGIVTGITRIDAAIQGEALPSPPPRQHNNGGISIENLLPFIVIVALVSGAIFRRIFGTFPGALLNGGLVGVATIVMGGGVMFAIIFGIVAFLFALIKGRESGEIGRGGFGGGGGFSSGGGGFSGGGGGFGGGGASGDW
jgi:uncharacterized protein